MKQYIKPTTTVENVVLDNLCQLALSNTTNADSNEAVETKGRDVWSEGYW